MAWTGQLLMAIIKFWEFKLVEEMTTDLELIISKWDESILAHLPQPIQRKGKTLNFWSCWGFEEIVDDRSLIVDKFGLFFFEEILEEFKFGLIK